MMLEVAHFFCQQTLKAHEEKSILVVGGFMGQKMTWEEMKQAYPNEWLLIVDAERDEFGQLISGVVERHSADKDVVYARPAPQKPTTFRYTGESTFRGFREHAERGYNI